MFRLLFLTLLALTWPVRPDPVPGPENIFLLAGQSNMSGRGGVKQNATGYIYWNGVVPPECAPDPSILRLDANLTWVIAKEPIHEGIDAKRINGVGPGMPFAHEILRVRPDYGTIGLVPCALAGSSISRWQRGTALYDRLMLRVNASVQTGGKIRGILWLLGGTDSKTQAEAAGYKPKLDQFLHDLREDLNIPDLVILQIAIAPGKSEFTSAVRSAQFKIKDPYIRTVDTKGLPVEWDNVHFTTPGQIQLGKLLVSSFFEPPQLNQNSNH